MSTKKTTTTDSTQKSQWSQTNNYNAAGLKTYEDSMQGVQNTLLPSLLDQVRNPFNNSYINSVRAQGSAAASQQGATGMQNVLDAARANGIGTNSAAGLALQQRQQRMNSSLQQQNLWNTNNMANQNYWNAASGIDNIAHMSPLLMGANGTSDSQGHSVQVQQTSGLGTWLPQVAGMALGAATGGIGAIGMGAAGIAKGALGGALGNPGMFSGGGGAEMPTPVMSGPGSYISGSSYSPMAGMTNVFNQGMGSFNPTPTVSPYGYGGGYSNGMDSYSNPFFPPTYR